MTKIPHVLYNINTLHIVKRFDSERGAKVSWSRKFNKDPELGVVSLEKFHNEIDHDIEVINLLSGKPCTIKKSEKGGPCDPSTERYHCM